MQSGRALVCLDVVFGVYFPVLGLYLKVCEEWDTKENFGGKATVRKKDVSGNQSMAILPISCGLVIGKHRSMSDDDGSLMSQNRHVEGL